MGATRALITIKRGDTTIYVNDRALAADYLAKITPAEGGTPGGEEVESRAELQRAALDAHQALNQLNKQPSHNLGLATAQAWGRLTGAERKALVPVRKKSNAARHNWQKAQEDSDTSGGTADTKAGFSGSQAGTEQAANLLPKSSADATAPTVAAHHLTHVLLRTADQSVTVPVQLSSGESESCRGTRPLCCGEM